MTLYLGNLSYRVRENDLEQLLSEFGEVSNARVVMDRATSALPTWQTRMLVVLSRLLASKSLRDVVSSFVRLRIVLVAKDTLKRAF